MPQSGKTAKWPKIQRNAKTTAAPSTAPVKPSYSTSSSAIAASAAKLEHLPDAIEVKRTNTMMQTRAPAFERRKSMSQTHALLGGIRSAARLNRTGQDPIYTTLYYTGDKVPEKNSDAKYKAKAVRIWDSDAKEAEDKLSQHDAEVSVIDDLHKPKFGAYLSKMGKGEVATLEFHGNIGPCDGCKERIKRAITYLAGKMYSDTNLEVFVCYLEEASDHVRGDDDVPTVYGYKDCSTKVTYNGWQLYCKDLGTFRGRIDRKEIEAPPAAKKLKSSVLHSPNRNSFAPLADSLSEESDG